MKQRKKPSLRFKGFDNDWEQRKLSKVVSVCSGMDYKHLSTGNIPVYGTGGYMLSVNKALSYDRDAIGIGRKGTIDKPYILRAPFWTVDTLFYAIPQNEECIDFVYDLFQNVDWKKKDESTGVPSLSKVAINNTNVIIPSEAEQRKIGSFTSQLDILLTLHQRKLEKLQNLKKAMLEKMFPKNGAKVPEIRFKGFTNDWEQRKLGECCQEFKSGSFIPASDIGDVGKYPVYGGNGLRGFSSEYNHDGEFALIGRQGALCGNMNYSVGRAYFTEHAIVVQANKTADTKFLYYLLKKMNLGQYSDQSAQPGLAVGKLVKLIALVPSVAEQIKIGYQFMGIDHLITLHQRKLRKLQNLKKAMLEKMFI